MKAEKNKNLPSYKELQVEVDRNFAKYIDIINGNSQKQLEDIMAYEFSRQSEAFRKSISNYTQRYKFWGNIDFETGYGTMAKERSEILKDHIEDFIWLYDNLCDYRSRYVLYGILKYWLVYDYLMLDKIKERLFCDYFDLDILKLNQESIIVDVGTFIGDTVMQFNSVYNKCKKIYCYEVDPYNIDIAQSNLSKYDFVEIRQKAVASKKGEMYLYTNKADTSNTQTVFDIEEKGSVVESVALDEDIIEKIDFIKMDIEGGEQEALRGCTRHIKENKTKLAICTYHGNEDIWKIPRMVDAVRDDYNFYMRYNGGTGFPTEYVFFAL